MVLILPLEIDLSRTIPERLLRPLVSAYIRGQILNDLSRHIDEVVRWWLNDNDVLSWTFSPESSQSAPTRALRREYTEDIHRYTEVLDEALPDVGDMLFDWYPCEHLNVSFLSYHANDNSIAVRITNG